MKCLAIMGVLEGTNVKCKNHEWVYDQLLSDPPQNGPYYCKRCGIHKQPEPPEWEKRFDKCLGEYYGHGKWSPVIKDFIRSLLEEKDKQIERS